MDRDDVGLGEQLVELAVLAELGLCRCALRIEDAQLEAGGTSRDSLADSAEADDPEGRAGELLGEEPVGPRAVPLARADAPVAFDDAPPGGQDEREGEVGGRRRQHAGRVRHRNSAAREGLHAQPVVADAEVRHEPEPWQSLERDRLVRDDQRLHVLERLVQLGERPHLDVAQLVEGRARIAARGENLQGASVPCRQGRR